MKKIVQIAIISMLLLPAVAQASAYSPVSISPYIRSGTQPAITEVEEDEIDPSFTKVDFQIKEIIIYPHGIVLIRKEATVSSGNKFYTEFDGNTFPGCVRIIEDEGMVKDITIKNNFRMYSTAETSPFNLKMLLNDNVGNVVELITSDGFYKGELIRELNGFVFLKDVEFLKIFGDGLQQRNASFFCLKLSDIENLILTSLPDFPEESEDLEVKSDNKPKTRIKWEDTGSGSRTVTLLYAISGISWKSEYYLDTFTPFGNAPAAKSRLEHWAVIKNNLDIDLVDVNLRLVAGDIKLNNPSIGFDGEDYLMDAAQYYINSYGGRGSSSSPSEPSIFTMQEFEVYTIPYKVTLKKGETKMLQVQNCDVEIVEEYVYDATHFSPRRNSYRTWENEEIGKVKKILKIKNNGKTWPAGMVNVYQDYILIGQDGIQWTPKGREAKVTIGVASDIVVKKKATVIETSPDNRYDDDYKYDITIELTNFKDEKVVVKVFDKFPSKAIGLKSTPDFEEKPGNQMAWEIELGSGKEKTIKISYETRD